MKEVTDPQLLAMLESGDLPEHPMARYGQAVRRVESRGNPNAVSSAGAIGADQFMPATAKAMGLANPRDPVMSAVARDLLLAENYDRFKDPVKALQAYNAGPAAVASGRPLPKETQEYAPKVMAAMTQGMKEVTDPELLARLNGGEVPKPPAPKQSQQSIARKAAEQTVAEMSPGMQFLVGAGKSMNDVINFGKKIIGQPVEDTSVQDAALTDTTAGAAGNLAGDVALTWVPGAGAFKLATAPKLIANVGGKTGTVLRAALGGGAAGATAEGMMGRDPVTGAEAGAAFGMALPVAAKVGNELVKQVQRFRGGAEGAAVEHLQKLAGGDRQRVIQDLNDTLPLVPGEIPTAGMAAREYSTWLPVLEKTARNSPAQGAFRKADEATAAARELALGDIAVGGRKIELPGGQELPSVYQTARSAVTDPQYAALMPEQMPYTPELAAVLEAPMARSALESANAKLAQTMRNAQQSGGQVPPLPRWNQQQGRYDTMPVEHLQRILKELDARIAHGNAPFEQVEARAALSNYLKTNPRYQKVTEDYRNLSAPQNQAQVAEAILAKLHNPADSTSQRLAATQNIMETPQQLFKRADLSPRFTNMRQVFAANPLDQAGPAKLDSVNAVIDSLRRQSTAEGYASNKGIVPEYQSVFDQIVGSLPDVMARPITILKSTLKKLGNRSDKEVDRIVNEAMADPQGLARLLSKVSPTERSAIMNSLRQMNVEVGARRAAVAGTVAANQEQ